MSLSATRTVPFLDLTLQHAGLRADIARDIEAIIDSSAFINGPQVAEFEQVFAAYCGADHCVGVASGLDALRIILLGLGIGPGDEVIVPAMTFVATWEAVTQVGALPVPVDVTSEDYCLDPAALRAAVTPRTAAVMPVHLFGQMADLRSIGELARSSSLAVVEDAAQAHGAVRDGQRAGGEGHAAFSFYPGKNLGAMGDAGAVVTADAELARRARALREHGQERKYHHDEVGWTARLDTIQAAVLLRKLPLLDEWNAARRAIAARYDEELAGVGDLVLPQTVTGAEHVWHVYVARTDDPAGLGAHLAARGVASGRHYPEPPHLSRAYESLGYRSGAFPIAESIGRECISLPLFPGMSDEQLADVVQGVRTWFSG
jgi:dTDP-3-amino-3,4,6-trideoxy-alpha-D-glucose transaminase